MKKLLYILMPLLLLSGFHGAAQTVIATQGFETTGDTWAFAVGGTPAGISAAAGAGDTPANQRISSGAQSWQTINGTQTATLNSVSVSGYSSVFIRIRVSSTSGNGTNGADAGDNVRAFVALNGGAFPGTADVTLSGNANARYGYTALLTSTSTAGTPSTIAAPQGGTSTNNYSTLVINIPAGSTSVALRVTTLNNDGNERWNIDNIELVGTPTATAPTVTVTAPTSLTSTGVQLNGTVNDNGSNVTNIVFRVGTTPGGPYTNTFTATPSTLAAGSGSTGIIAVLIGLTAGQTYYYVAEATNGVGTTTTTEQSFTTPTSAVPTVTVTAPTALTSTGIQLNGTVNDNSSNVTNIVFRVGTTPGGPYTNTFTATPSTLVAGSGPTGIIAILIGLVSGQTYYYVAEATNGIGTTTTTEQSFTMPTPAAPTVTANAATNVTGDGAQLNATVADNYSNTSILFRYGTTPGGPYPFTATATPGTLADGDGPTSIIAILIGLVSNQTYYYVAEATNGVGTTTSAQMSFTTLAVPTCFSTQSFEVGELANIDSGVDRVSAATGAGDTPANQRIRTGTQSWQIINVLDTLILSSSNISAYEDVSVTLRVSSTSLTGGNGADGGDFVRVYLNLNGAGFPATPDISLVGNGNARWGYDATLTGSTTAGTPLNLAAPQGGTSTNNYATLVVNIPNGTSSVALRIIAQNDNANEIWNIDDIELCGTPIVLSPCVEPSAQPTALNMTSTGSQIDGTFTASATANNYLVVRSTSPTLSSDPLDGILYTPGDALGGGVVVSYGPATTFSTTGLTAGTNYYFFVFAANGACIGAPDYLLNPLTGSRATVPGNVTLEVGCIDATSIDLGWTYPVVGGYDGVVIFARQAATPSGPGTDNASSYTANSDYSLATDLGAKGRVVYSGTGTNVTVTGLTAGVSYTFAAYTYVDAAASVWSSGTTVSRTIGLNNVTNALVTPANTALEVNWINPAAGCFDEILVVINTTAGIGFAPAGSYIGTANTVYAGPNQVVFAAASGTNVTTTNLVNGTTYYYEIFIRRGAAWSSGVEVSGVPNLVTIFEPGDFMIVAVNTNGGPEDEVCFTSFQAITPGTSFEITDNGYERDNAGQWGNTEGVIRFERGALASAIPAGTTICIQGDGTVAADFDIYVNGVLDDANWTIGSINGLGQLNINSTNDQIWFLQGGSWSNPFSGTHNSVYSGNVLYGWTGDGWIAAPGYASTSGSTLFPGMDCFVTDLQAIANRYKAKYTGAFTNATQRTWLSRVNTPANWTGSADNAAYAAQLPNYSGASVTFGILAAAYTDGEWVGDADINWFNCRNWGTLEVPDTTVNVTIATSGNNARIDETAAFSDRFGDKAKVNNLTIVNGMQVLMETNGAYLVVDGDLTIQDGGEIDMSDGAGNTATMELRGNWLNQSTAGNDGFTQGTGSKVIFNGDAPQTITDNNNIENFANLEVDNVTGLTLNSPVDVATNLNLISGIITTTTTNLLRLGDGATATGASDASHVNGPVAKVGVDAFTFPVGKNGVLRTISIGAPATNASFQAEYFRASPLTAFGTALLAGDVSYISQDEYWTLDRTNGTANVPVTLTWDANSQVTNPADIFVTRWGGANWAQAGGVGLGAAGGFTGTAASGSVTSASVPAFSPFTLGSLVNTFPVEYLSFEARVVDETVVLDWVTASEVNNDRFVVERSADRNLFAPIGEVAGRGTTKGEQRYTFTDLAPVNGVNYYRLRQVDLDGSTELSDIVEATLSPDAQMAIRGAWPNPTSGAWFVELNLPVGAPVTLRIMTAEGQLVTTQTEVLPAGIARMTADLSGVAAGVYLCEITARGQRLMTKLVRQ